VKGKEILMQTYVSIDDKLMRAALRASGLPTKRATVEEGLRLLIQIKGQTSMRRLRGRVKWEGDLSKSRTARVLETI